ncbi:MAG: replicative DNA helicase [Gammaproteobacteria bacterium]|nr:replicative DNA helicase [Gammaproteobacteria bacterium]
MNDRALIAERSVVGGILVAPEKLDAVLEIVTPDDFSDHRLQTAMRAAIEVSRSGPVDIVTVAEHLEANGQAGRVGGLAFLGELAGEVYATAALSGYARIVANHAVARRVAAIGDSLRTVDAGSWGSAVDDAMRVLSAVGVSRAVADCDLATAVDGALIDIQRASKQLPGVPSGIARLDKTTGGFHPGDLAVLGARTGIGKTALMIRFAIGADCPVGIISSEQPRNQIAMRLLAMQAPANLSSLRNGQIDAASRKRVDDAAELLRQRTMKINDRPRPSVAEIRRQARTWRQRHQIEVLFVDYLQRLRPEDSKRPRHEQVAEIAVGLKELARELEIPVIALAQLNREVEGRQDSTPRISDLRDSGAIEQEADLILLLKRDDDSDVAELDVAKNRHGPRGFIKLTWKAWCARFDDYVFDRESVDRHGVSQ